MCFVLPDSKNVKSNPVLKIVVARNTSRKNQAHFWFLAKREDDAFDDERHKVFGRVVFFF